MMHCRKVCTDLSIFDIGEIDSTSLSPAFLPKAWLPSFELLLCKNFRNEVNTLILKKKA